MKYLLLAVLITITSCCGIRYRTEDVVDIGYRSTVLVDTAGGHCTGFAIAHDTIITAAHCVTSPTVSIHFGRLEVIAKTILDDNDSDIAILQIQPIPELVPLLIRTGKIRPGEQLIGIGFSFYSHGNITFNIGSYIAIYENNYIATDVCYRGSSGGPVLDEFGRVVGLCSKISPEIDIYNEIFHSHRDINMLVPIQQVIQ